MAILTLEELHRGDVIGIERDERTHTWITRAIVEAQKKQGLPEHECLISHVGMIVRLSEMVEMVPPNGRIAPLEKNYPLTRAHVYRYDFTGADAQRLQLCDAVVNKAIWAGNARYNFAGVASFHLRFLKPFSVKHSKFCSQLIADSFRECGYPLVAEAGEDCTPAELCLAKALDYVGYLDLPALAEAGVVEAIPVPG